MLSGKSLIQSSATRRCASGKPHKGKPLDVGSAALSKAIGKATWGRLLKLGLVKEQTRCNIMVLGVASRLHTSLHQERGDASAMLRAAQLEPETHRKSLAHWRHILETAESLGGAVAPPQRQLRPKSDWQLKPEPGPTLHASVWTATQPSRRSMEARYMSSLELTLAALRGQAAAGALVRCDGVEGDLHELLPHWNYVSVHFRTAAQARPLWHSATSTWRHPAWASLGDYESEAEALATVFLTFGAGSQCSLHRDAVSSAWLIAAGERDLWVLPPWAAAEALPDVDLASGKYGDTFSLYDPWADSNRHGAWRRAVLKPGDWVFMPVGWWHVVRATEGSVMLNFRMPRGDE